jgi:putative transposase
MLAFTSALFSWLVCRFRSRADLELEVIALRHQLAVLRRQRPGRTRVSSIDRLLWAWLYRLWPRCLDVIVVVKPATVIQWRRQGFRLTGDGGQGLDGRRSIARRVI